MFVVDMPMAPASSADSTSDLSTINPLAITGIFVSVWILLIILGIIPGDISIACGRKDFIEASPSFKHSES